MKTCLSRFSLFCAVLLSACSTAKLEARLEANPQCKDISNSKSGALMPCPGTDKAFYREAGLAPAKAPEANKSAQSGEVAERQFDCKPQVHQKTGSALPCPAPD